MGVIVAIGGGELKDFETLPIDREIVLLTKKKHPKALFIPTASGDAEGYWETFQKVYGEKLGCETDVLWLIDPNQRPSATERERKVFSTDIVYVGGGNTLRMLKLWRRFDVNMLLKRAYKRGIILSGLSAGAICWFRYGESGSKHFMKNGKNTEASMRVRGLDLLPFTCSPHHIREKEIRGRKLPDLMHRTPGVALAIDDGAAILFRDNHYQVITATAHVKIQKVFRQGKSIVWETIPNTGMISRLEKTSQKV